MKMTQEQLQSMIKSAVDSAVEPLKDTQRKYADNLQGSGEETTPEQKAAAIETAAKNAEFGGETLEPGMRLARTAKLMVLSKNDIEKAYFYAAGGGATGAKGMYPEDKQLHGTLKALMASTPSDGGFLIPEQYTNEIIPLLRNTAVVRGMGARSLPLNNGNLNIPRMLGGASSYYLGESQDAKMSKPQFGNMRLSGKKLVTLVPVSNDLIRSTSPEADRIIRDDMLKSMALREDFAALYGKGTEFEPRGIYETEGVEKVQVNGLPTSDNLADFLGTLMTKNIDWNSVGWIFNGYVWNVLYNLKTANGDYLHRAEMNAGKFLGHPFKIANQIAVDATAQRKTDIFFGDFNEFMIGEEMGLELMASNEATYMNGGQLVSAFSQDQTVIKMTAKHDFGVRHPEGFVIGQKVHTKA